MYSNEVDDKEPFWFGPVAIKASEKSKKGSYHFGPLPKILKSYDYSNHYKFKGYPVRD